MPRLRRVRIRLTAPEERLRDTPTLVKTPSGYVQQNPWLSVANKQMELMGRYMAEFSVTPASRSRVTTLGQGPSTINVITGVPRVERVLISRDQEGRLVETVVDRPGPGSGPVHRIELDERL